MEPAQASQTVPLDAERPSGGHPPGPATPRKAKRRGSRSSPLVLVLLVALAVLLVLLVIQVRRASVLGARVVALETELAMAQERIDAYDRHLDEVRTRVGALSGELGELQALLDAGPEANAAEAKAGEQTGAAAPGPAPDSVPEPATEPAPSPTAGD